MIAYENLHDTLSFYSIDCRESYYISSGKTIFSFPEESFRMDYYALCICTSGQIHIEIDNKKYTISKHGFLISAPSTIVRFLKTSDDFRMKLLFFDKNFLLKNISDPFIIEKMNIFRETSFSIINSNENDASVLINLLEYMSKKVRKKGRYIDEIIRTIIFNILLETAEIVNKGNISIDNDEIKNNLFFKFNKLIRENIQHSRNVQFYAEQLFISRKYLIEVVKKACGKTPHQIIDEILLKEAYSMLGNPGLTISEIAFELQFNSVSAFGRFFKKHTTISPSEYRNNENFSY